MQTTRRTDISSIITLLVVVILLGGCSAGRKNGDRPPGEHLKAELAMREDPVAPNHCRFVGTIVSVDERSCPHAPCIATVRVDSVLRYGMAFLHPVAPGETVNVLFLYTLGPTAELYPDLKPPLPGLSVGSSFLAEMQFHDRMQNELDVAPRYTIARYERK